MQRSTRRRSTFAEKTTVMKRDKIIYWILTGLVSLAMLASAFMYLSGNAELMESFKTLGIPIYLVGLLGVAKLVGAVLLVAPVWRWLKEWAYAGFAFTFGGAVWVHVSTGTPWVAPLVFMALLAVSYVYWHRLATAQ